MTVTRALFALPGALVLAILTVVLINGSPENTPPAYAGPCAREPFLYFASDDPDDDDPLGFVDLFATAGKRFSRAFFVDTSPNVPPPGKPEPYASISIAPDPLPGNAGIQTAFTPASADTEFETILVVTIDENVPPGAYDFEITITCHTDSDTIDVRLYVDTCPVPQSAPLGQSTPTPEPFPEECADPTPTPAASPTPSPTPEASPSPTVSTTPIPTPTRPPGIELLWGDADCDGSVTSRDNQAELRSVLQQPPLSQSIPCFLLRLGIRILTGIPLAQPASDPTAFWGDVDCDGDVTSRDNQALLRNVLQQNPLGQTEPCPDIGAEITAVAAE